MTGSDRSRRCKMYFMTFSFWEATWLLNVNDLVSIAFNHSLCVFVATILGKNHFYNFAAIFWISLQRGSTGGENVGKDCVQSKRRICSEKVLFPHLSHNDRELLFVGSVCKQEVERPEWLHKLKICLVRSSLKMISWKTIICAKTYSLLVYCRRRVEGGWRCVLWSQRGPSPRRQCLRHHPQQTPH